MIKSITTSKLFVTSSRQKSIMAAIENPINVELVQQLSEYLSDESKEDLKDALQYNQSVNDAATSQSGDSNGAIDDTSDGDFGGVGTPSSVGGSAPSGGSTPSGGNVFDDFSFDDTSSEATADDGALSEESSAVEESTAVSGNPILGATDISDISVPVTEIKGLLNANSDTCGVIRAECEDDEFWLYYADEVNLNDIMISVIEILNASGYTYLKFNRLGRSNNAIIFDIKQSMGEIQSIQEIAKEA